jgi:hypothetical protein
MLSFTFISSLFRLFPPLLFSFKIIIFWDMTTGSLVAGSNNLLWQIQVNIYQTTRHHILQSYCHENLKFQFSYSLSSCLSSIFLSPSVQLL